jgi:(4S)-4-hydroxy-5-phosphonooxypentane-2,3-dione isomerase
MYVQFVTINVKPGFTAEFEEAFRINYEGTRKEPGNYRFDVLRSHDDPMCYTIYEVFASEAAFLAHRTTPHYAECVKRIDPIIVQPRGKRYFSAIMADYLATDRV